MHLLGMANRSDLYLGRASFYIQMMPSALVLACAPMSNIPIPPPPGAPGYTQNPSFVDQLAQGQFLVQIPGLHGQSFSYHQLAEMAKQRVLKPESLVQRVGEPYWSPASAVPGVFSEKNYIVAVILAWFLGGLGIDRFYLGYTGIGIAKLLTFGGFGIWWLIDLILIALRKVPDRQGKPLS